MKSTLPVIILAGGLGTRISEESETRPKPMVLLQGKPILWHLIQIYASQGYDRFRIATGYKAEVIEEWVNENNKLNTWGFTCEIKAVFTGMDTQTGGRIRPILESESADRFMVTYGDGLANISLSALENFHSSHGKIATVTSVRPPARFGHIQSLNGVVTQFGEKNQTDVGWINGGFFVLNREILNYLDGDEVPLEQEPMSRLVQDGELMTLQHFGFWQPMDTLREKNLLEEFAKQTPPPWQQIPHQIG